MDESVLLSKHEHLSLDLRFHVKSHSMWLEPQFCMWWRQECPGSLAVPAWLQDPKRPFLRRMREWKNQTLNILWIHVHAYVLPTCTYTIHNTQCTCTQVCSAYRQRYLGTFIFTTSMLSGNQMVNKMLKNKNFNYYQLKIYLLFKVWDELCSY